MPRLRIPRLPVLTPGSTLLGAPSTLVSRQGQNGQGGQGGGAQDGHDSNSNPDPDSDSSDDSGIDSTAIVRYNFL